MPVPNFALDQEEGRRRFLAWLAHELRNPLAAIAGAVQVLRNSSLSETDTRELYDIIWRQTLAIQTTVDRLPHLVHVAQDDVDRRLSPESIANASQVNRDVHGDDARRENVAPDATDLAARMSPSSGDMQDERLAILVIDDQRDVRFPAGRLLTQAGFRVEIAASGAEGIHLAKQLRPDVILCDISLPDHDGYEVIRQLRRVLDPTHRLFIAMTGYDNEAERQKASAAGFQQFITKPIDYSKLIADLHQIKRAP